MPDFDLKTLLHIMPYGSQILNFYKEKGTLTEFLRNKLVDIIIRNIYPYVMK